MRRSGRRRVYTRSRAGRLFKALLRGCRWGDTVSRGARRMLPHHHGEEGRRGVLRRDEERCKTKYAVEERACAEGKNRTMQRARTQGRRRKTLASGCRHAGPARAWPTSSRPAQQLVAETKTVAAPSAQAATRTKQQEERCSRTTGLPTVCRAMARMILQPLSPLAPSG